MRYDFCNKYFGMPLNELSASDLKVFFQTNRQENLDLEFKSVNQEDFKKQLGVVQKEICSLMNSEGGLLILGSPTENKVPGTSYKSCNGNLTEIPNDWLNEDRIMEVIRSGIQPMPQRIDLKLVGNVGIFEVQPSDHKPHQVLGTYYMRSFTSSSVAPHYLVEALCRQVKVPQLDCRITLDSIRKFPENDQAHITHYLVKNLPTELRSWFKLRFTIIMFNLTKSMNEHDVTLQVTTTGVFKSALPAYSSAEFISNGHQTRQFVFSPILSTGTPVTMEYEVIFPISNKLNAEKEQILISFFGRQSPAKASRYVLKNDDSVFYSEDLNDLLLEIEENYQLGEKVPVEQLWKEFTKR